MICSGYKKNLLPMVDRSRYASTVPKNQTPGLIFNLVSTAAGKGFTKEV